MVTKVQHTVCYMHNDENAIRRYACTLPSVYITTARMYQPSYRGVTRRPNALLRIPPPATHAQFIRAPSASAGHVLLCRNDSPALHVSAPPPPPEEERSAERREQKTAATLLRSAFTNMLQEISRYELAQPYYCHADVAADIKASQPQPLQAAPGRA